MPANPSPAESPAPPARHPAACRREVARLYAEARECKPDAQAATRLASIVALAARMIEGAELEERIAKFKRQGERHAQP